MSAPSVVCATAEIALNRYLRLEPSVIDECAHLSGRSMEFGVTGAPLSLVVEFIDSGVRVMSEAPRIADVKVSGTPAALIASLRRMSGPDGGLPTGLEVEGDAELLNRFRAMVSRVGFDPEEWLAPLLGGVAAHRMVGGLKKIFDWTGSNTRRMADHSAEYLREETYDLARGRDVEAWMNEVDDTRESLDRLEARLRRLEEPSAISLTAMREN